MDLKEIYENKTGKDPWFENELIGTYGLTQDYVEWLEEQLTIGDVVKQSEQLFCKECNVDLKKANGFCPEYIECENTNTK